jgi:hypothetical protein
MRRPLRILRRTLAATLAVSALATVPALAAKDASDYAWVAKIDCGSGTVKVGSGQDIWSPLVAIKSGKKYRPVAWDLKAGDKVIRERKPGWRKRKRMKCTYVDKAAKGTVTVLKRTS